MRGSRGDATVMLLIVVAGTLMGALAAAPIIDIGDGIAAHFALYASAVAAGIYLYRKLVRPILRAIDVIFGLDRRVGKIEKHLGIEPEG